MICPKCGYKNNENEPICPICNYEIVKKEEKVEVKNDHIELKIVIVCLVIVLLVGGAIGIGMKFEAFNNNKKVMIEEAPLLIKNINSYIYYSNIHESINMDESNINLADYKNHLYVPVPYSNICEYKDGNWNKDLCKAFFDDLNGKFCKLPLSTCTLLPDYAYFEFDATSLKNNFVMKYGKVTCTYLDGNTYCESKI